MDTDHAPFGRGYFVIHEMGLVKIYRCRPTKFEVSSFTSSKFTLERATIINKYKQVTTELTFLCTATA